MSALTFFHVYRKIVDKSARDSSQLK